MKEELNVEKQRNKKYLVYSIIFVLLLILITVGIGYAFFRPEIGNSTSKATIIGNTDCLTVNLKEVSDRDLSMLGAEYPVTDTWALHSINGIPNIKPVEVQVINECTKTQEDIKYTLALTTLAKSSGYMDDNQIRFQVNKKIGNEEANRLKGKDYLSNLTKIATNNTNYDLIKNAISTKLTEKNMNINNYPTINSYIIDNGTIGINKTNTYYIYLWIDYYEGDKEAYNGVEHERTYDGSTENKKFETMINLLVNTPEVEDTYVPFENRLVKQLRKDDTNKTLSQEEVGDMYRYQGEDTKVTSNYICFGTHSDSECKGNPEKYMYRIIGITYDGRLKLLKNNPIKEGSTTTFAWNNKSYISSSSEYYCEPDGVCPDWPNSLLYKRLNGISNGTKSASGNYNNGGNTDIFVDNPIYDYLKSGDSNSGVNISSEWYNKIEDHKWLYGDIPQTTSGVNNTGLIVYEIESGQRSTSHYVKKDEWVSENYNWNQTVVAKIGLMYVHDYYLSVSDTAKCYGSTVSSCLPGWVYVSANGISTEWLMSQRGGILDEKSYGAHRISHSSEYEGKVVLNAFYIGNSVRPVFYLKSSVQISGKGTSTEPYIITN